MVKTNCQFCKKEFYYYPSIQKGLFCSYKCYHLSIKGIYKVNSGSFKKGHTLNNGIPKTEEVKRKISEKMKGGNSTSFKKGHQHSIEALKKMSEASKGKKQSEEAIFKRIEKIKGEKHWAWISDRTQLKKSDRSHKDYAYTYWRQQVYLRDNFKCKINNKDCNGKIEAHHILSWKEYPELRYEINNGITLCHAHHPRKRAEEKRLIVNFQQLVPVSMVTI
jgi:hypothetical protein